VTRIAPVALLAIIMACSSRGANDSKRPPPTPTTDGAPMTDDDDDDDPVLRAIKKAVPDAVSASRLDLGDTGLRGYWVTLKSPAGSHDLDRGLGVVTRDDATFLHGKDGMRAVIDSGTQDALVLARAAMTLLEDGGEPITDIDLLEADYARKEARDAKVTPPTRSGTTLVYWSYFRPRSKPRLFRSTVDLATLEVKRSRPADDEDPIDRAVRNLASNNGTLVDAAIRDLVKACADPRAPKTLAETLRSHSRPDARALAAENLAECRDADAVPALIVALEKDTDRNVRSRCIGALVAIGDPRARAALEKAAKDDADEGIRSMAERWLKKLK
jgi:hypothetical protein